VGILTKRLAFLPTETVVRGLKDVAACGAGFDGPDGAGVGPGVGPEAPAGDDCPREVKYPLAPPSSAIIASATNLASDATPNGTTKTQYDIYPSAISAIEVSSLPPVAIFCLLPWESVNVILAVQAPVLRC
jgi:hypothetical protein